MKGFRFEELAGDRELHVIRRHQFPGILARPETMHQRTPAGGCAPIKDRMETGVSQGRRKGTALVVYPWRPPLALERLTGMARRPTGCLGWFPVAARQVLWAGPSFRTGGAGNQRA